MTTGIIAISIFLSVSILISMKSHIQHTKNHSYNTVPLQWLWPNDFHHIITETSPPPPPPKNRTDFMPLLILIIMSVWVTHSTAAAKLIFNDNNPIDVLAQAHPTPNSSIVSATAVPPYVFNPPPHKVVFSQLMFMLFHICIWLHVVWIYWFLLLTHRARPEIPL